MSPNTFLYFIFEFTIKASIHAGTHRTENQYSVFKVNKLIVIVCTSKPSTEAKSNENAKI